MFCLIVSSLLPCFISLSSEFLVEFCIPLNWCFYICIFPLSSLTRPVLCMVSKMLFTFFQHYCSVCPIYFVYATPLIFFSLIYILFGQNDEFLFKSSITMLLSLQFSFWCIAYLLKSCLYICYKQVVIRVCQC